MLEPEMAFCGLDGCMGLAESFIHYLTQFTMEECSQDLALFARFVDKTLMTKLDTIAQSTFERLPYAEAIAILTKRNKQFEYPISYGMDLQSEHERFLTDNTFKKPVIVYDFPRTIKPFYMRLNDDQKTVAAMDVLVPGIGEIIGGSQREERLAILDSRMLEQGLSRKDYWWYLESRKYGTVPHSGFGLGFERLLMMVTGIRNIRDVIPFPRTPNHIDF
jgi:asparaginyl-tRNA synthetase